jgi:hypothetical protein
MSDTKTDRELLLAAAKAAGMDRMWFANDGADSPMFFHRPNKSVYGEWNPLTDDGDALRLAVKLQMKVDASGRYIIVNDFMYGDEEIADRDKAVRRAVVRAAAAMAPQEKSDG